MRKPLALAKNTFRELIRSKILYSLLFFASAMVLVAALFGTVTIGDQVKVIKDFGLFSISIFTVAFAVISGAALLNKELARKTIYNILAKPVRRWEFLLGKYLGMLATAVLMIALMGLGLQIFSYCFDGKIDGSLAAACCFISLELMIVCATAIFFSAIVVTPMLSGLFTFGVFLAGRSSDYILYFVNSGELSGVLAYCLNGIYAIVPHLNLLNVSNDAAYGRVPALSYFGWSAAYAASYSCVLLVLAHIIFSKRELN